MASKFHQLELKSYQRDYVVYEQIDCEKNSSMPDVVVSLKPTEKPSPKYAKWSIVGLIIFVIVVILLTLPLFTTPNNIERSSSLGCLEVDSIGITDGIVDCPRGFIHRCGGKCYNCLMMTCGDSQRCIQSVQPRCARNEHPETTCFINDYPLLTYTIKQPCSLSTGGDAICCY